MYVCISKQDIIHFVNESDKSDQTLQKRGCVLRARRAKPHNNLVVNFAIDNDQRCLSIHWRIRRDLITSLRNEEGDYIGNRDTKRTAFVAPITFVLWRH